MSPEPPLGFVLRRPRAEDAGEVTALIVEMELAQEGMAETTLADVRDDWRPLDLERDAWLLSDAGRLVAYGVLEPHPRGFSADGIVHPEATGRGLGRFLVRVMEGRAVELAPGRGGVILNTASLQDEPGRRLLAAEGYRPARTFLRMLAGLEQRPLVPELAGVELRPLVPGEERVLQSVLDRSFAEHWGYVPEPFDAWWRRVLEVNGGDASLFFLAIEDDRPIGAVLGVPRRFGVGWIGLLGVLPEERGRGIGRALLLRAFEAFHERGEQNVGLAVDSENETGATRLYESAGMHVAFGAVTYEKELQQVPS